MHATQGRWIFEHTPLSRMRAAQCGTDSRLYNYIVGELKHVCGNNIRLSAGCGAAGFQEISRQNVSVTDSVGGYSANYLKG